MSDVSVLAKLAACSQIFEAAQLLKSYDVLDCEPSEVVKRYVQQNPDINEAMQSIGN